MSARPFCSFPERRWDRRLFPVSPKSRSRSSRPRRRETELIRSPRLLSMSRAPLVSSPASGLPIRSNLSHVKADANGAALMRTLCPRIRNFIPADESSSVATFLRSSGGLCDEAGSHRHDQRLSPRPLLLRPVRGEEPLAAGKAIWLEEEAENDGAVGRHRLVPVAGRPPDELEQRRGDAAVVAIKHLDPNPRELGRLPRHVGDVEIARGQLRRVFGLDVGMHDLAGLR